MKDYRFDGSISETALRNYLSRAISMARLCMSPQREDDLRMLENLGAKFVGRAAYVWREDDGEEEHFQAAADLVAAYRDRDPDTVFQACIFEAVYEHILGKTPIPAWVFEEFGLPVEKRTFNYEAMLYDRDAAFQEPVKWQPHAGNNWMRDYWPGPPVPGSVPDMSKLETRLWFYYRARRYIDAGYEALHLGQVHLMNNNDPDHRHWWDVLSRIRAYAREHARRRFVFLDAHTHGVAQPDGRLLFDFHSYPQHIKDVVEKPYRGELHANFRHAIYGKSLGGITPSGWTCDHLPYLVEFDNWRASGKPDHHWGTHMWVWGCDEISWFARQPAAYRAEYLRYAHHRVRELDPAGHLQMPGGRRLSEPKDNLAYYHANTRSPASPTGWNDEETIKAIWAET
jgi:hypothetical protein